MVSANNGPTSVVFSIHWAQGTCQPNTGFSSGVGRRCQKISISKLRFSKIGMVQRQIIQAQLYSCSGFKFPETIFFQSLNGFIMITDRLIYSVRLAQNCPVVIQVNTDEGSQILFLHTNS